MNLKQFQKLKPHQELYNTETKKFTTKKDVIREIIRRAIEISRTGDRIEFEKGYVYEHLLDRLTIPDPMRVRNEVRLFLKKIKLDEFSK